MESKICSKCGEDKPVSEYYSKKRRSGSIYIFARCITCIQEQQKEYRSNGDFERIEYPKGYTRICEPRKRSSAGAYPHLYCGKEQPIDNFRTTDKRNQRSRRCKSCEQLVNIERFKEKPREWFEGRLHMTPAQLASLCHVPRTLVEEVLDGFDLNASKWCNSCKLVLPLEAFGWSPDQCDACSGDVITDSAKGLLKLPWGIPTTGQPRYWSQRV